MNSGRGIRPRVSAPRFLLPLSSEAISLTPRPGRWLVSAFGELVFIGLPPAQALRERPGNDSSVLIPVFSSACFCARGQPHWLFHSIITLVSLKMFAQKKPRVWPQFILGFQGNFPSSSDAMGEIARTFSPYLAGQEVNLASAEIYLFILDQKQAH